MAFNWVLNGLDVPGLCWILNGLGSFFIPTRFMSSYRSELIDVMVLFSKAFNKKPFRSSLSFSLPATIQTLEHLDLGLSFLSLSLSPPCACLRVCEPLLRCAYQWSSSLLLIPSPFVSVQLTGLISPIFPKLSPISEQCNALNFTPNLSAQFVSLRLVNLICYLCFWIGIGIGVSTCAMPGYYDIDDILMEEEVGWWLWETFCLFVCLSLHWFKLIRLAFPDEKLLNNFWIRLYQLFFMWEQMESVYLILVLKQTVYVFFSTKCDMTLISGFIPLMVSILTFFTWKPTWVSTK